MSQSRLDLKSTTHLPKVAWAKGSYLTDIDGKQYIDGSGGPAVYCIGHGNEEVNEAISKQLGRIAHGYRYNFTTDALEELTEIITRRCGGDLQNVIFLTGGSEAVESCLKLALQHQFAIGQKFRRKFIARERSWHGNTLGALGVSGFLDRRIAFEGAFIDALNLALLMRNTSKTQYSEKGRRPSQPSSSSPSSAQQAAACLPLKVMQDVSARFAPSTAC
jgi:adenosylmethionine-8-amino-7-oxononanoate aminotransferase